MESTTSFVLLYVALLGGPLAASLVALSLRWTRTWQVLLTAYVGEVICTETFRVWHTAHVQALLASGALTLGTNARTAPLASRLLVDIGPALAVGGLALWVRRRRPRR